MLEGWSHSLMSQTLGLKLLEVVLQMTPLSFRLCCAQILYVGLAYMCV